MSNPLKYPKLRWPIELRLESAGDQRFLLIRDPVGITPDPLLLVPDVAPIIATFEGTLSVEDIVKKFHPYGATSKLVEELVALLDTHYFLSSPRFFSAEKKVRSDFKQLEIRPAALAGLGYSADKDKLSETISNYLLSSQNGAAAGLAGKMIGLIAPHIDYNRGGACYGSIYGSLEHENPDLYVLIGTAHQFSREIFHLTRKHFQSPLGTLKAELPLIDKLASMYGIDRSYRDEFLHKNEHSLELQVPFLNFILNRKISNNGTTHAPTILPILVGSFHHMLVKDKCPEDFPEYDEFIASLAESLAEYQKAGRRICFVAGVDMAHVGAAFGDAGKLTEKQMKEIEKLDHEYLKYISVQDKRSFIEHIIKDQNERKICGYPSIYSMLDVFDRLGIRYTSKLFRYQQAVDYKSDCAVTFAGMGLYEVS